MARRGLCFLVLALSLTILRSEPPSETPDEDATEKPKCQCGKLRVEIVEIEKNSPVPALDVFIQPHVEDATGPLSLKARTNASGVASLTDVPCGIAVIQVSAKGWKTFGKRFDLEPRGTGECTAKVTLEPDVTPTDH